MTTHTWSTADLTDDYPDLSVLPYGLTSYGGKTQFSGPVHLVKCFEDNSLVKSLLNSSGICPIHQVPRVLVVDGASSLRCALLGDQIATAAVANQWAGVVIAGAIRDATFMKTLGLGVLALGTCPKKSTRLGAGQSDLATINLLGVEIYADQWLFADADGVVLAPSTISV